MQDETNLTEDELWNALEEALDASRVDASDGPSCEPGCVTSGVIIHRLGVTRYKAIVALRELSASGVVRPQMVQVSDAWGHTQRVRGYCFVPETDRD